MIVARLPAYHTWWYQALSPAGWHELSEGGVQWRYSDFKPKDPISISYYLTQLPSSADDVPAFVEHLRALSTDTDNLQEKLSLIQEIVLASYGKDPDSPEGKRFALAQRWFAPRKDFSMSDLTERQKAVLLKLDSIIANAK